MSKRLQQRHKHSRRLFNMSWCQAQACTPLLTVYPACRLKAGSGCTERIQGLGSSRPPLDDQFTVLCDCGMQRSWRSFRPSNLSNAQTGTRDGFRASPQVRGSIRRTLDQMDDCRFMRWLVAICVQKAQSKPYLHISRITDLWVVSHREDVIMCD